MTDSGELVRTARALALRAHAGQRRKAGDVPYFTHLEAVAELVVKHGYDDEVTVAAAYLHDLLEDQPAYADELRAVMPPVVVETVQVLSETKLDSRGNERPKAERFDDYCAALRQPTDAARRALPISAADKIHNAYSLIEADPKERLLQRLNTRPAEHRDHYARLRAVYAGSLHTSLLRAFDDATVALVAKIEELSKRNLYVRLDAASCARARAAARLAVPRGDHVTLAYRIDEAVLGRALPPGCGLGTRVELCAIAEHVDARAQVWAIQLGSDTRRPYDGGTLHLTVSRARDARSRDSNDVLEVVPGTPIDVALTGVVAWSEEGSRASDDQ